MKAKIYWIHAMTPLHVGAGRGVGFIDLPIAREKVTGWPLVPGSAVKGVWRDHFSQNGTNGQLRDVAFGKAVDNNEDHAGALVLTDARIVLLPIRSFYGTFAYATSPLALKRLARDLESIGVSKIPAIPSDLSDGKAGVTGDSQLVANEKVYLEDLDFSVKPKEAQEWGDFLARNIFEEEWQGLFKQRFVILPDDSFDFLCETGTEVSARVRIDDEKKIVAKGALWYEESLPAETVLAGIAWCDRVFGQDGATPQAILETFCNSPISCQIGGKATVGKGQVRCPFTGVEA